MEYSLIDYELKITDENKESIEEMLKVRWIEFFKLFRKLDSSALNNFI